MHSIINARDLRATLPTVVAAVRRGARYTVLYRSRPAFRIVPVDEPPAPTTPLEEDPLYGAGPVGRSRDGGSAADHDAVLYGE